MPLRPRAVVLALLAIAVSVPFAAGYLLPQNDFLVLALAALAGYSPYLLVLVVLGALVLRQWLVGAALGVLLLGQVAVLAPSYLPDDDVDGPRLVVMTTNVLFGQADLEAVVRLVREHDVDLLGVQELTPQAVARLRAAGLEDLLPYSVLNEAPSSRGAGLWSNRPVREVPTWVSTFETSSADLEVDGTRLRVRVLHPPPPTRARPDPWQVDYDGFVGAARSDTRGPMLLIGDFNASVHHRRLRALMGDRWRDAAGVAGAGLVRTWGPHAGRPEVLDPDHVLVDRRMGVATFDVVEVPGSDHRAVVATVVLPTRP